MHVHVYDNILSEMKIGVRIIGINVHNKKLSIEE